MSDLRSDEPLHTWLTAGDPAADGSEPSADEIISLRRSVLGQVPARGRLWRWLPLAAAVAAVVVAAVLLSTTSLDTPSGTDAVIPAAPDTAPGAPGTEPNGRHQQIQFATENGTRIIWVLNPDLTL